jgi:FkbM family methyltransferase
MAALAAHWGCRVIAFEPQVLAPKFYNQTLSHFVQRHLRSFWRATSALNGWNSRVVWVPAAVGESTGEVFRLQRPVGDWGQVHAGTHASNAAEAASHDNFLPGDASVDDVAVVRVADIVPAAAAIKIDVEGSEAAAMRSCERLLLDPALQLAAIEFQGSSGAEYSEGLFVQLLQGGMSAYIFQEEYFRHSSFCIFCCQAYSLMYICNFVTLCTGASAPPPPACRLSP